MVPLNKAYGYLNNLISIFEEMTKLFLFLQPSISLNSYLKSEITSMLPHP